VGTLRRPRPGALRAVTGIPQPATDCQDTRHYRLGYQAERHRAVQTAHRVLASWMDKPGGVC